MVWLLAFPVALFFIGRDMLFGQYPPHDAVSWVMMPMASVLFAIFATLPFIGIAFLIGCAFKSEPKKASERRLVAIRDKDGIAGQFFLGTGIISGSQYYFYYAKDKDGAFRPGKIEASSRVRVYEEERTDATLVEWQWELVQGWAWSIAFPVNQGGYSWDFHVPTGTIRTGYTM